LQSHTVSQRQKDDEQTLHVRTDVLAQRSKLSKISQRIHLHQCIDIRMHTTFASHLSRSKRFCCTGLFATFQFTGASTRPPDVIKAAAELFRLCSQSANSNLRCTYTSRQKDRPFLVISSVPDRHTEGLTAMVRFWPTSQIGFLCIQPKYYAYCLLVPER
jgi:hypothetical protein